MQDEVAAEIADEASGRPDRSAPSAVSVARWRFQRALCLAVGLLFRVFFALRQRHRPNLPGAFILAANHSSFLDPMVLQLLFPRHITFLMDAAIYRRRLLGWFYRFWGAIPISSSAPAGALKSALRAVRDGRVVAIFPEGRISRDGRLQEGAAGVALLMQRARVPVVPVAILGSYEILPRRARLLRPGRLLVVYGDPITPPVDTDRKASAQALRDEVMRSLADLLERHRAER